MIKHIVMFKLKDKALAKEAKEKADQLKGVIQSLRGMEVVINSDDAPDSNFELALICDFDSIEGLDEYQVHPEHKKFGAYISTIRAEGGRACIDYEY